MRTIVFFDLPNIYFADKRNYLLFRKFLLKEGFIMMQESVYSKIVLNSQQSTFLLERIRKQAPKKRAYSSTNHNRKTIFSNRIHNWKKQNKYNK